MGWNDLLRSFTVLALCWAGAEKMLQEGRLRQAARMVFGLLSLLVWLSGLQGLLAQVLPAGTEPPETLLEAGCHPKRRMYGQYMRSIWIGRQKKPCVPPDAMARWR